MGFLAKIFSAIGGNIINSMNTECITWFLDEPECPKCIIEK